MFGPDELKKRFYPQFLNPAGLAQLEYMRERFLDLATSMDSMMPDGREKSVAMTELQDSSMWAIKAICVNPEFWSTDKQRPKPTAAERNQNGTWKVIYDDGSIVQEMEDWEFKIVGAQIPVDGPLRVQPDAVMKKRKIVGFRSEEEGSWILVYSDGSEGGTIRQGLLEELLEAFRASKS